MEIEIVASYKTVCTLKAFAVSKSHLAWNDYESTIITLCDIKDGDKEIHLQGHHSVICALQFNLAGDFLISGSSDYLIQWNIDEVTSAFASGELVRGHVLCRSSSSPACLAISPNNQLVCSVSEKLLFFCDITSNTVLCEIGVKNISCGQFIDEEHFATVSLSGLTSLWNVGTGNCIWKNQSQHGHSLTSIACRNSSAFSVGSSISQVREFRFHEKNAEFKESWKSDLDERLMHANPEWKQQDAGAAGQVLSLLYVEPDSTPSKTFPPPPCFLFCATDRNLFAINVESRDVTVCRFPEDGQDGSLIKQAIFSADVPNNKVYCATVRMFKNTIEIFSLSYPQDGSSVDISIVSKMTMFKPVTSLSGKPAPTKHRPVKSTLEHCRSSEAPDWSDRIAVQSSGTLCALSCLVNSIDVSSRNSHVTFCLSNATAQICKLPMAANNIKFKVVAGHNKPVLGSSWSNDKDLLLTFSADRQVKLWTSPYTGEPVLTMEVLLNSSKTSKTASNFVGASFYYLDKFILAAANNSLIMYKYALHEGPKDDVKTYLNQNKYKAVCKRPMASAQSVTCFAAPNNLFSYIVLVCGSDRSLDVLDMNTAQCVHKYNDVHTRAPHVLKMATGSPLVSSASCDLYLTAASSDGVKLWDLRTQSCVRKFHNHLCVSKCDVAFSPCGRSIATSTDEKSVYIYDLRHHFPSHVLKTDEKVTALSFTAGSTQLIAAAETSRIYTWSAQ